ncbi:MAG: HlyD family efflux transporter periplasmic adaptor subunit [Bacteroidia bacterium]|nr:HlyD family efflux transporter periplasmic adaptor subunit [Bacteroidia bacterium]
MLNISKNRIEGLVDLKQYKSFSMVRDYKSVKILRRLLTVFFFILLVIMFIPWTQNIRGRGTLTTLKPDQRPQSLHSVIAGRIEKWYVTEGNYVKKGDTILYISEINQDYFDSNLLKRTEEQIKSKELAVESYMENIKAVDSQIDAMIRTQNLKLEQARNSVKQAELKIISDSIDIKAFKTELEIAQRQEQRFQDLYEAGLKSLTDLELKKQNTQAVLAKYIGAENKLLTSKNELINKEIELNSIENQYRDKMSKAKSDKFASLSKMYDAEAVVTKMQNQYMNYSVRSGLYYITAPQEGYITQAVRSGIGEVIKEGEELLNIMPAKYDLAVTMYVRPMDLPLVKIGQEVRFIFDGWPSVAFSGWPNISFGTFGGTVVAIDNFTSSNGLFRILVSPDPNDIEWPKELRVGSGAIGMALLKDVPIWYELWRKLNGFPPDYYSREDLIDKNQKEKLNEIL